jgi:hypothetical protein
VRRLNNLFGQAARGKIHRLFYPRLQLCRVADLRRLVAKVTLFTLRGLPFKWPRQLPRWAQQIFGPGLPRPRRPPPPRGAQAGPHGPRYLRVRFRVLLGAKSEGDVTCLRSAPPPTSPYPGTSSWPRPPPHCLQPSSSETASEAVYASFAAVARRMSVRGRRTREEASRVSALQRFRQRGPQGRGGADKQASRPRPAPVTPPPWRTHPPMLVQGAA